MDSWRTLPKTVNLIYRSTTYLAQTFDSTYVYKVALNDMKGVGVSNNRVSLLLFNLAMLCVSLIKKALLRIFKRRYYAFYFFSTQFDTNRLS